MVLVALTGRREQRLVHLARSHAALLAELTVAVLHLCNRRQRDRLDVAAALRTRGVALGRRCILHLACLDRAHRAVFGVVGTRIKFRATHRALAQGQGVDAGLHALLYRRALTWSAQYAWVLYFVGASLYSALVLHDGVLSG